MNEQSERRCGHSALRFNKETQKLETFDKYPIHLGEEGTEQFIVSVSVDGDHTYQEKIHDPFIRSTTTVCYTGIKNALKVLFGGLNVKVQTCVDGTPGASRAIMTLNPHVLEQETKEIMESRQSSREGYGHDDNCAMKADGK